MSRLFIGLSEITLSRMEKLADEIQYYYFNNMNQKRLQFYVNIQEMVDSSNKVFFDWKHDLVDDIEFMLRDSGTGYTKTEYGITFKPNTLFRNLERKMKTNRKIETDFISNINIIEEDGTSFTVSGKDFSVKAAENQHSVIKQTEIGEHTLTVKRVTLRTKELIRVSNIYINVMEEFVKVLEKLPSYSLAIIAKDIYTYYSSNKEHDRTHLLNNLYRQLEKIYKNEIVYFENYHYDRMQVRANNYFDLDGSHVIYLLHIEEICKLILKFRGDKIEDFEEDEE